MTGGSQVGDQLISQSPGFNNFAWKHRVSAFVGICNCLLVRSKFQTPSAWETQTAQGRGRHCGRLVFHWLAPVAPHRATAKCGGRLRHGEARWT